MFFWDTFWKARCSCRLVGRFGSHWYDSITFPFSLSCKDIGIQLVFFVFVFGLCQLFWIIFQATLALSVLSIRMIETYQSIVKKNFQKTMQDSNFARSMWIIHGLCFIEAIIDWLGTLFGAIIQPNNAQLQTLFYSLWKFIAVFLFCGLNYFIFKICQKCWYQLNRKMSSVGNFHSKNNEKLKYGFYKLLALFIIFSMLIVFLLIQAIVEFASYVNYKERSFIQEPILVIVFIYLPIWSGISAVCLVYSWVASKNLLKNRTKTTIDSTTKGDPTSRTKTYKSETSSSSNSDDDKTTSSPDFKD